MSLRGRDSFSEYRYMKAAIERMKKADHTVSDVVRGSSAEAPYTEHSVRIRGTDQYLSLVTNAKIKQYTAECRDVEKIIAEAPVKMREMLTMRYINGATMKEVAQAFGYSSPDSAFQRINRFFNSRKIK